MLRNILVATVVSGALAAYVLTPVVGTAAGGEPMACGQEKPASPPPPPAPSPTPAPTPKPAPKPPA
jgi:hypothetical protein